MENDQNKLIAMEIHMLGTVVAKKTIQAMQNHRVLAEAGISMLQFGVLRAICRQPCTISELSPIMMVDPSTLVAAVDALERKGLAVRGRDPNDRRRVPISATEEGARIAACPPLKGPFAAKDNPLLNSIEAMGVERARLLLDLLREMVGHMPDGPDLLDQVTTWVRLQSPAVFHPSSEQEQEHTAQ
ncbi:MAG: MarR family transcriptional regulator [Anaerolineae bacterium]|nr:MarR family transcriptional regulator [Anaerolineae bacterium]